MDVAASEFKVEGKDCYDLGLWYPESERGDASLKMTGAQLGEFYAQLCKDFPIITIEDPFDQDDWAAWEALTKALGTEKQVVGDDLTVTNVTRVKKAIDQKACNALLLKVNQIGSVTESIDAVKMCKQSGWGVMTSHRSGETEDTTIADLAVGLCTGQIKKSWAPKLCTRVPAGASRSGWATEPTLGDLFQGCEFGWATEPAFAQPRLWVFSMLLALVARGVYRRFFRRLQSLVLRESGGARGDARSVAVHALPGDCRLQQYEAAAHESTKGSSRSDSAAGDGLGPNCRANYQRQGALEISTSTAAAAGFCPARCSASHIHAWLFLTAEFQNQVSIPCIRLNSVPAASRGLCGPRAIPCSVVAANQQLADLQPVDLMFGAAGRAGRAPGCCSGGGNWAHVVLAAYGQQHVSWEHIFPWHASGCVSCAACAASHRCRGPHAAGAVGPGTSRLRGLQHLAAACINVAGAVGTLQPLRRQEHAADLQICSSGLQPLSVTGAPYVTRCRVPLQGPGPPGLAALGAPPLSSDWSWSDRDTELSAVDADSVAAVRRRTAGKGRGGAEDAATVAMALQAQCRAGALRSCVQLFKLWPKAYFGRWPLVLDFQSGEVCRSSGGAAPLPMLLAICQQDPSPKVRAAALASVCALLEAPSVRSFPVPLERDGVGNSAGGSLSEQLAKTLRQSHSVVFKLVQCSNVGDVQNALRACGDLASSTPYTKLKPGLLTEIVQRLVPFLRGMTDLTCLDAVPQVVSAAVAAMGVALKREDCAAELQSCLFTGRGQSGVPLADELVKSVLHVVSLVNKLPSGASSAQITQPSPTKTRPKKGAAALDLEPGDSVVTQECALLASRVLHFRPAVLPQTTVEMYQELVSSLVEMGHSGFRVRGFRLLSDLLEPPTTTTEGLASTEAPETEAATQAARPPSQLSPSWCAGLARTVWLKACAPAELSSTVRASAMSALPGLLLTAIQRQEAEGSVTVAPVPEALATLRSGASDANATVRTAAAQAFGALSHLRFHAVEGGPSETEAVLQLVMCLCVDTAGDVRSAAVTALASFATVELSAAAGQSSAASLVGVAGGAAGASLLPPSIWRQAAKVTLDVCGDQSDKARASAMRTLGCLVDLLGSDDSDREEAAAYPSSIPPGLGPSPGNAPATASGTGSKPWDVTASMEVRIALALADGVQTPPPKCQWNACRSAGQLFRCRNLLAAQDTARQALDVLLMPICQQVSSAANLKVRIQATQALTQLLASGLWTQADADAVLLAVCNGIDVLQDNDGSAGLRRFGGSMPGPKSGPPKVAKAFKPETSGGYPTPSAPPGLEKPPTTPSSRPQTAAEDRQQATYLAQLRCELLGLAERCATCAVEAMSHPSSPSSAGGDYLEKSLLKALKAIGPELARLLKEEAKASSNEAKQLSSRPALLSHLNAVLGEKWAIKGIVSELPDEPAAPCLQEGGAF
ncbi:unnamed protein product [Polarella glacialis]|uniref:phosphopyruvate hydratase n=1 Tax=Polarella glacialis TaxID=89957 RepID=A0A813HXR4_POLGL|nr:unnamed protein product [Polarella glacialis]